MTDSAALEARLDEMESVTRRGPHGEKLTSLLRDARTALRELQEGLQAANEMLDRKTGLIADLTTACHVHSDGARRWKEKLVEAEARAERAEAETARLQERCDVLEPGAMNFPTAFNHAEANRKALAALRSTLIALRDKWRGQGAIIDTFHATMGSGYKVCADELTQAAGLPTQG